MEQYLYRIQPTRDGFMLGSTVEEDRIVGEHFDYLKRLTERGVVLLAGRTLNTDPSSFGIVVFVAEDDTAARTILENDPAVRGGVFEGVLFPYRIALVSAAILSS
ncbi:YciI family protein [Candidatus Bipolaricaulota bacterium]|nr:YciI family protein [Candidatus Bipolaricaulota bacterium]